MMKLAIVQRWNPEIHGCEPGEEYLFHGHYICLSLLETYEIARNFSEFRRRGATIELIHPYNVENRFMALPKTLGIRLLQRKWRNFSGS